MNTTNEDKSSIQNAIIKDIAEQVTNIKYGTVAIKIHQSKIVQIEATEKTRYEAVWILEKGGGI